MFRSPQLAGERNGDDEDGHGDGSEPPPEAGKSDGDDFGGANEKAGWKLQMGTGDGLEKGRLRHDR